VWRVRRDMVFKYGRKKNTTVRTQCNDRTEGPDGPEGPRDVDRGNDRTDGPEGPRDVDRGNDRTDGPEGPRDVDRGNDRTERSIYLRRSIFYRWVL